MSPKIKINIVSSNDLVRLALREYLETMSFSVSTHNSVKAFFDLYAPRPNGLLLVDLDGSELGIDELMASLEFKSIKNRAIFLTERKIEIMDGFDWKANDPVILEKPPVASAVLKAINFLITQNSMADRNCA